MRLKSIAVIAFISLIVVLLPGQAVATDYKAKAVFICVDSEMNPQPSYDPKKEYVFSDLMRFLDSNGVACILLYGADATKDNVEKYGNGASFFFYDGHGFGYYWDQRTPYTMGTRNGLALIDGLMTQDEFLSRVRLADGAIADMVGACYAGGYIGSSSEAELPMAVPADLWARRISDYSYTFLSAGAKAYIYSHYSTEFLDKMSVGGSILSAILNSAASRDLTNYFGSAIYSYQSDIRHPYFPQYPQIIGRCGGFTGDPKLTWESVFHFPAPNKGYGFVSGRVVDNKDHVISTATLRIDDISITFDSRDGHFIAGMIPTGIHTVFYNAPGYAEQAQVLEINHNLTTQAPTCILAPSATMTGTSASLGEIFGKVVSPLGQMIPGTCIRIDESLMPTNPAGEFRFTLVHPGIYTIYYDAPGYSGQIQVVEVKAGQTTKPPTVIM